MAGKFDYENAFCIMWYACQCGHQERIWNSRDGVTPSGLQCSSCGGTAYHAAKQQDVYAPRHELHHGQKFFRNGTLEEAHSIVLKRLNCPPLCFELKDFDAEAYGFHDGWPIVDIYGHIGEY